MWVVLRAKFKDTMHVKHPARFQNMLEPQLVSAPFTFSLVNFTILVLKMGAEYSHKNIFNLRTNIRKSINIIRNVKTRN